MDIDCPAAARFVFLYKLVLNKMVVITAFDSKSTPLQSIAKHAFSFLPVSTFHIPYPNRKVWITARDIRQQFALVHFAISTLTPIRFRHRNTHQTYLYYTVQFDIRQMRLEWQCGAKRICVRAFPVMRG